MMRPSVQGVDHSVCCVLDAVVTYARDSSCCLLSSRGEGGGGGRHTGTRLTPCYIADSQQTYCSKMRENRSFCVPMSVA